MLKCFAILCAGAFLPLMISACGGGVNVVSAPCDCNAVPATVAAPQGVQTPQAQPAAANLHCAP